MSNAKVHKSYRPRYQTPKSRHKVTNYTKRIKMLRPNLKKYNVKNRMVVRFTNSKVICQVIQAYKQGDKVIAEASSSELKKFGLNVGLTNYSAAYATGMLAARRTLIANSVDLEKTDEKAKESTSDSEDETSDKITVFLDIGLKRNTKGARVYAALKGAVDGGLYIPHNAERIFPDNLSDRIHGSAVASYMSQLNGTEKYSKQFGAYEKAGINADNIGDKLREVYGKVMEVKEKKVPVTYTKK